MQFAHSWWINSSKSLNKSEESFPLPRNIKQTKFYTGRQKCNYYKYDWCTYFRNRLNIAFSTKIWTREIHKP